MMKDHLASCCPWIAGLAATMVTALLPDLRADYATTVSGLDPVVYYRFGTTNAVPTELPAVNLGTLGTAFNGEYQAMTSTRGLAGAIVGDADTAVSIDGSTGQQVVVPFSPDYNPSGPFSIEFWANPANVDSGNRTVAISMINGQNPANGDDRSGWAVRHSASDWQVLLGFDHSDGATFYHTTLTASGAALAGEWQHVVVVYTPDLLTLYVNGAEAASDTPAKPVMPNHAAPLILGDRGYTGWDYNGRVDEFAIYTAALTPTEIKTHYDNGKNAARAKAYADLVREKNPALYLRLGEPSLTLPVAINSGTLGTAVDALYFAGTTPGVAGPQQPAVTGFEATNRAARFGGGYVQAPPLALTTDTCTMVCWLKRNGVQPARAGIMHNRKVTAPETKATGLGFQDNGLALSYNWEDRGETYNFNPGFVPPDQTWTFYAVTIASDQAIMYMGTAGGLVSATNVFEHVQHDFSGTGFEIGWDNYQAPRRFQGDLDEFAIFDKTLTGAQVQSLYNAALPAILGVTRTPADPVYEGTSATFNVAVAGPTPITYQWRKDGANLAGKTTATLALTDLKLTDSGEYDVVATTGGMTLTSPASRLNVVSSPPVFLARPASAVRFINGSVQFVANLRGSAPLSIQWKKGTDVIPGATQATLTLTDLQPADAGEYTIVASNPYGQDQASATLTLETPEKYSAAITDAGPKGYWRLDETSGSVAYDYWGGRDGTLVAGATQGVAGPQPTAFQGFEADNAAYELNGAGGKVTIPALDINKATITIVAWIKPNGTPDDYDGIVFCRGGNTVAGLDYQTQGQLGYHWNDTADTYGWASGLYPLEGQWNFVALVVEPDKGTLYLDDGNGLISAENAVTHGVEEFNGPLTLGQDGTSGRLFKGQIDEVAVFDRALTSDEITALRAAGFAGTYAAKPVTFTQQPKSQTILVGSQHSLEAKVSGSVPFTYQWQKNGQDLAGAIRSRLDFASATEADTGTYQLVVTQGANKITSNAATLTVKPEPAYINLADGLVLHLNFDSDYQDTSGRNNHGEAQGSPAIVAGQVGSGALKYNTVVSGGAVSEANYVTLGNPADLQFGGTTSFTIAFWTRFSGSPGDLPFLCNNVNSYGGAGLTLAPSYGSGSWSWSLNDGPAPAGWPGYAAQYGDEAGYPNAVNDNQWHHLAFLVDRNGDVTTYMDGVRVHAKSIAGLAFNLDTALPYNIGQGDGGAYAEAGTFEMDDLGIWRRVLTEYEAQSIYIVGSKYRRSFDSEVPAEVRMQILKTANGVEIQWSAGTLEASESVHGGYTPVVGASAPSYKVEPASGTKYYRVKVQ